ncbi:hypothetical protein ACJJTC_011106 [Scirpophaga incertulas]
MDSSDSDEDCYGNVALKLQRMKNKYIEDRIESTNLLNDSSELDEIVKNTNIPIKDKTTFADEMEKSPGCVVNDDTDAAIIDTLIETSCKRITRSAAKRNSREITAIENIAPKRTARGRNQPSNSSNSNFTPAQSGTTQQNLTQQCTAPHNSTRGRGRRRGRGRSRRSDIRQIFESITIPTYSVGNTDEYPDQCDSQTLFSANPSTDTDSVVIIDDNELDENEEMSVKVYWQSSEFVKFMIRKFQKLTQIFDYFSNRENVSQDKLFFTFNDRILKPTDTPESINYSIAKFIDGGIVNQSVSKLVTVTNSNYVKNGIKIKFQCQNVKKPFETVIGMDEKLSIAMLKYSEHIEMSLDRLKFEFDGDSLSGKTTARALDLEGGECIDVKIIS